MILEAIDWRFEHKYGNAQDSTLKHIICLLVHHIMIGDVSFIDDFQKRGGCLYLMNAGHQSHAETTVIFIIPPDIHQ